MRKIPLTVCVQRIVINSRSSRRSNFQQAARNELRRFRRCGIFTTGWRINDRVGLHANRAVGVQQFAQANPRGEAFTKDDDCIWNVRTLINAIFRNEGRLPGRYQRQQRRRNFG